MGGASSSGDNSSGSSSSSSSGSGVEFVVIAMVSVVVPSYLLIQLISNYARVQGVLLGKGAGRGILMFPFWTPREPWPTPAAELK